VGTPHIANQAITSALVAANALATPHFANQGILSASIAALAVGTPHLANQAVLSAKVGAAAIGTPHIANQAITSALVAGGALATPHIANQGILSASLGAGEIGHAHIANYGIVSGKYASGSITEEALASGISIDISETTQEPTYRAVQNVGAYEAVMFTASGYFNLAQPGTAGRMPAFGIAAAAVNSGQLGTVLTFGRVTNTGWNFSGYIGNQVFVQMSSEIAVSSPAASGNYVQRMGQVVAPATVFLIPDPTFIQIGQ
jgi:hypothetical protein